jgi:hypothetical protein
MSPQGIRVVCMFLVPLLVSSSSAAATPAPDWTSIKATAQRVEIRYRSTLIGRTGMPPEEFDKKYEASIMFQAPLTRPMDLILDGISNSAYHPDPGGFDTHWGITFLDASGNRLLVVYLDRFGLFGRINDKNVAFKDSRILESLRWSMCYFPALY